MLNRRQSALLLTLVVPGPLVFAQAQDAYLYQESYGTGVPTNADNYTQGLVRSANEHPNATRSIKFKPFGSVLQDQDVGSLRDVEWTWRVNVTDFSAPNAEGRVSTANGYDEVIFVDPHVVNTVYDFTWPGGGNINSALNLSTGAFCITNIGMTGMPANVSNTYTEKNEGSTNCTPILGDQCVIAITDTVSSLPGETGCYSDSDPFFTLPECAGTLGYAYNQTSKHRAIIVTGNLNSAGTSQSLLSGGAIWGGMTDASNGTNTSNYEAAVNQLQIMMIRPVVNGTKPTPQLLCMRVNTSQLVETGGNTSDGNGGGSGDKSLGTSFRHGTGVGAAVAVAWFVLVIMYSM